MRIAVAVGSVCLAALVGMALNANVTVPTRGESPPSAADVAMSIYRIGLSRFDTALTRLDSAIVTGDSQHAQRAFRSARVAYKRIELFTEYFGSFLVRDLNGVPLPRAEDEDPETPLPPVGLQAIEPALFPRMQKGEMSAMRLKIGAMRRAIPLLQRAGADTFPGDRHVFDAMRQEIARVATLGTAGFDATITGDGILESADALTGVKDAFSPYRETLRQRDTALARSIDARLDSAIQYLRDHPDFNAFDRLTFIVSYVTPAAHAVAGAAEQLGIGPPDRPRAWSARASSPFDRSAFDARFYAALDAPAPSRELIALGRDLFADPALSPSGTRSCATCHLPERAFTDGRSRPRLLESHRAAGAPRNTPTLINAALQPTQFADGRVRTLEDQATDVLGSPGEMGGSLMGAASTIRRNPVYQQRFAAAFPAQPSDSALSALNIRLALAAYVRSLVRLDSRFDRAAQGDTAAMTIDERRGFDVFMGKAHCGTCHFAPLFNGALPPTMWESEPEVIGVPRQSGGVVVDPDSGRFKVRRIDQHLHAFKTPTLRNVALTAPYMHNGAFRTLEEVIDFYDAGGGVGAGMAVDHQTLPADSLHLTKKEKRQLVAFLQSLTDTVGTTQRGQPPANR